MTRTARIAGCSGIAAVVLLSSAALIGQAPAAYKTPRTPWGDPDLQGIWPSTDMVGVPIERPVEFGTRATLSDTEFQQRRAQTARQAQADDEETVVPRAGGGDGTGPPSHWGERGEAQRQNSLIVDPPDGRMPKMTPYGAERMAMRATKSSTGEGPFDSAADQATVNDPKTWTAPWTVSFPLRRDDAYGFYEYACHEGNNAMRNILSGARASEQ